MNEMMFPKQGKKPKKKRAIKKTFIEASDLQQFAKGQECTLRLDGICNHDPETTVLAHIERKGFGMMGSKPHDLSAVHACSSCHDEIDGRINGSFPRGDNYEDKIELAKFNALLETLDRAIRAGLVTL